MEDKKVPHDCTGNFWTPYIQIDFQFLVMVIEIWREEPSVACLSQKYCKTRKILHFNALRVSCFPMEVLLVVHDLLKNNIIQHFFLQPNVDTYYSQSSYNNKGKYVFIIWRNRMMKIRISLTTRNMQHSKLDYTFLSKLTITASDVDCSISSMILCMIFPNMRI